MTLCTQCQKLPLNTPFNLNTPRSTHRLGTWKWHKQHKPSCPFCELIWKTSALDGYDDDAIIGLTRILDGYVPGIGTDNPLKELGDPVIVPFVTALPNGASAIGHGQALSATAKAVRMKKLVRPVPTE
jgi:hypothetical protein